MVIFFRGMGGLVLASLTLSIVLIIIFARFLNPAVFVTLGVIGSLLAQGLSLAARDKLWDSHVMFIPLPIISALIVFGYFNFMFSVDFWLDKGFYQSKDSVNTCINVIENIRFPEK